MSRYDTLPFNDWEREQLESGYHFGMALDVMGDEPKFRPEDPDMVWMLKSKIGVVEVEGWDAYDVWFEFTDEGRRTLRKGIADKHREARAFDRKLEQEAAQ